MSSTSLLDNGCQTSETVGNGSLYKSKGTNGTAEVYSNGRRKSSSGSLPGKLANNSNGYSESVHRNGLIHSLDSVTSLNNMKNTNTLSNGHLNGDLQHRTTSVDHSYTNGHASSNGHANGVTLKSLKQTGALQQRSAVLSKTSVPPTANGKSHIPNSKATITSSPSAIKKHSDLYSYKTMMVLGAVLAMSAIGITTDQDWYHMAKIGLQLLCIGLLVFAITKYRWFYVALMTIPRDILGGYRYAKILINVGYCQRKNWTMLHMFAENVRKHPKKVCFYFEDQVWTFKDVDEQSNRIANHFASQGITKGDCVSVFMENRPQYVCIWLGLSKIGVIPALINFNLRQQPLKHCFEVAKPKAIIFGHELGSAIKEVLELGPLPDCAIYSTGHGQDDLLFNSLDLDSRIEEAAATQPIIPSPINFSDKLLYIFTSGTTGLPKAAVIKHSRFIFFTMGIHYFVGISNDEVIYDPLPLYHTAGGMIGVGQALIHGCTAVLRRKFSASSYFKDCAKYKCTAAQYIGEICRYLLCQPPNAADTQHKVKLMFGNGLRPQIWTDFAKRFNIKTISEFYGATEGNCNIINIDNHVGSVGFISMIAPFIYPVTLIRIDETSGEPIRDPRTGLVMRCKPNEPGELVGKIVANHPVRDFDGYADSTATTKKIVKNVFRNGDAAFRTGDVLIMDEFGYFYFKDRTGDTFRWKGENCSTAEVEAVVSNVCGLKDAVVYGVEIPGTDGRAGMAAILDPEGTLDFTVLAAGVVKSLPSYARPLFVRIVKQLDMTGTYKMKKVELQKESFDVTKISDNIYFFSGDKYILMDNSLYTKIISGQVRL